MIDPRLPVTCPAPIDGRPLAGPRIFVFGSARSGTTLLLNLFRTFTGVTVLDREHCVRTLAADPTPGWVAAKRTPHCADHLSADLAAVADIWIVDIVRDPRDVVTSRLAKWPGYYCDFPRWKRDVGAAGRLRGRHLRLLHVRYEQLVTAGDAIQRGLADILGLRTRVPFSRFPAVVPADISEQAQAALGGVRPLSGDRIGRWRDDVASRRRVAEQLHAHPHMEILLQAAGYELP
jgi:hypothetical protein